MENGKFIKNIYHILILAMFLSPVFSYAYSDKTTHPALTQEVVNLFNYYYPSLKLNDEEKELVMKGSIDEDEGTRPLNHFYDPVYGIGLLGINRTAKDWSQNTMAQSNAKAMAGMVTSIKPPLSYPADYSWDRAIYDYAYGDKSRALENLGHILHLVEDMTVPPHTRNDQHLVYVDESPYETYTSQFGPDNFKIADKLFKEKEKPVIFDSLDKYFDSLALYTSNNFFSKDTTPDQTSRYYEPMIVKERTEVLSNKESATFGFNLIKKEEIRLVLIKSKFDYVTNNTKKDYFITDKDNLILFDYWSILSQKAVLNGAGVMKLFFDEVEKEKKTLALYNKNKTFLVRMAEVAKNNLANIFSAFGNTDDKIEVLPHSISPGGEGNNVTSLVKGDESPQTEVVSVQKEEEQISASSSPSRGGLRWGRSLTTEFTSEIEATSTTDVVENNQNQIEVIENVVATTTITATTTDEGVISLIDEVDRDSLIQITERPTGGNWAVPSEESDEGGSTSFIEDQSATSTSTTTEETISDTSATTTATTTPEIVEEETIEILPLSVVINEVAWMGTSASYNDEWIELYNNTDKDIDLSNWTLYTEDEDIYKPLSGTIKAKGYYLLERTDDTNISDISADLIYTGALNNSGEHLLLSYKKDGEATTTIDEISKANNWNNKGVASSNGYYSMERYDKNKVGTDWNNWGTSLGEFILNGKDASSNAIKGTPKAKNSISYKITNGSSYLSEDKTLIAKNSPYLIDRNGLIINSNITLTIDPDVVVKIVSPNEPKINVNGTIKANGEKDKPVVFTAFSDDEYGGDMNGDGFSTFTTSGVCVSNNCPTAGSWTQILINSSSKNSYFKNTVFRYGGRGVAYDQKYRSLVTADNTDVVINDSIFENSGSNGLYLLNSNSTISNNLFKNNKANAFYSLYITGGGSSEIKNNIFDSNTYGIYTDSNSKIISNTLNSNTNGAVYGRGVNEIFDNSGTNNGINGIVVSGDIVGANATKTLAKNSLPYIIKGGDVNVPANSALVIGSGIVMKFKDNRLSVDGRLSVSGEDNNKVIFTSVYDDSDGNDALNDGQTNGAVSGYQGVYLKSGSNSEIRGADFKYLYNGLSYDNSPINIGNIIFSNNNLAINSVGNNIIDWANGITFIGNTATSTIYLGE